MKRLITFAAMTFLTACQSGEVDARQGETSYPNSDQVRTGRKGTSTAQWQGKTSSGDLRFDSAACMVMDGKIINFYAPATAKDSIGEDTPVLPQVNGSKGGDGWAINVMDSQGATHSGAGKANAEAPPTLTVNAKLLDSTSAGKAALDTVETTIRIECTAIDDLGSSSR